MLDQKTIRKRLPTTLLNRFAVWIRGAALLASLALPFPGQAQEAGVSAPVDPKTVAELVKRLEYLESKVSELQKKLDATTFNAASPVPVAEPSAAYNRAC
jgi:hypothetical protein